MNHKNWLNLQNGCLGLGVHFRVMQEVKALGHGGMCEVGDAGVEEQPEARLQPTLLSSTALQVLNYQRQIILFQFLLLLDFFKAHFLSINHLCNFRSQNAWGSELIMHAIMPVDIWMKVMFQHSIPSLKLISTSDDLMIYLL